MKEKEERGDEKAKEEEKLYKRSEYMEFCSILSFFSVGLLEKRLKMTIKSVQTKISLFDS